MKEIKSSGLLEGDEIVAQAVVEQDAKGDLEEIGEAMSPDSSDLLFLMEDIYSEGVINAMTDYGDRVVTLTVSDEFSGEIPSAEHRPTRRDVVHTELASG